MSHAIGGLRFTFVYVGSINRGCNSQPKHGEEMMVMTVKVEGWGIVLVLLSGNRVEGNNDGMRVNLAG